MFMTQTKSLFAAFNLCFSCAILATIGDALSPRGIWEQIKALKVRGQK